MTLSFCFVLLLAADLLVRVECVEAHVNARSQLKNGLNATALK